MKSEILFKQILKESEDFDGEGYDDVTDDEITDSRYLDMTYDFYSDEEMAAEGYKKLGTRASRAKGVDWYADWGNDEFRKPDSSRVIQRKFHPEVEQSTQSHYIDWDRDNADTNGYSKDIDTDDEATANIKAKDYRGHNWSNPSILDTRQWDAEMDDITAANRNLTLRTHDYLEDEEGYPELVDFGPEADGASFYD